MNRTYIVTPIGHILNLIAIVRFWSFELLKEDDRCNTNQNIWSLLVKAAYAIMLLSDV